MAIIPSTPTPLPGADFAVHITNPADAALVEARLKEMGFRAPDQWSAYHPYLKVYPKGSFDGKSTGYHGECVIELTESVFTPAQFFAWFGHLDLTSENSPAEKAVAPADLTKAPANPPDFVVDMGPGGNETLSRIVQELAFKAGLRWTGDSRIVQSVEKRTLFIARTLWPRNRMCIAHGGNPQDFSLDLQTLPCFSAATQMGEIVRLLATPVAPVAPPKPPAPVGPTIHGHIAVYAKGSKTVAVGCATIDLWLLRQITFNRTITAGNRTIASITSNRGETLTAAQSKELLDYVAAVDAYVP